MAPTPKLRFADTVYALDMGNNALRNWLARGQVEPEGGFGGGGWTEFSIRDLVLFALVRKLTEHGTTVENAALFIRYALNELWREDFNTDPSHILAAPATRSGFVDPNAEPGLPDRLYVFTNSKGKPQVSWGSARHPVDAESWTAIDVHRTLAPVVARALERMVARAETARKRSA